MNAKIAFVNDGTKKWVTQIECVSVDWEKQKNNKKIYWKIQHQKCADHRWWMWVCGAGATYSSSVQNCRCVCVCSVSAVCACVRLSTRCHKLLLKAAHQLWQQFGCTREHQDCHPQFNFQCHCVMHAYAVVNWSRGSMELGTKWASLKW